MRREETVDETGLVGDDQSKDQADHAGCGDQSFVDPGKAVASDGEGRGKGQCHQHHADDGPYSENQ